MDIQLNFINQSNDQNNSEVVIFSKNASTGIDELAVAWLVIQNCGQGDNHPFVYPTGMQVGAGDSYGNFTPRLEAQNGQLFHMTRTPSGDKLSLAGPAMSHTEVEVRNDLPMGAISAGIYKAGKLFANKTAIAPGQKAVFEIRPTLWLGVASQIVQGQVMNAAILSSINTEISLLGIASADIVMTGGGAGPTATPFVFNLQNVQMA